MNIKIRHFIMHEIGQTSLALPPMSKKSRVAVHLLSELYQLKSRSIGKGKARFPVLERGPKSAVFGVDERRISAIIGYTRGEVSSGYAGSNKSAGRMGALWHALSGETRKAAGKDSHRSGASAGGSGKNREGAVVGQGADRLGEGNVGYELLKRMGYVSP